MTWVVLWFVLGLIGGVIGTYINYRRTGVVKVEDIVYTVLFSALGALLFVYAVVCLLSDVYKDTTLSWMKKEIYTKKKED